MDDIWKALSSIHVQINPDKSRLNTDKNYAKDLMADQASGNWKKFYQAIDALEQGCGYPPFPELLEICKKAALQDNQRLLRIAEQKPSMLEMVYIFLCVDQVVKLAWVGSDAFSKSLALFECLRQSLCNRNEVEGKNACIIASGLCKLSVQEPEQFRYLLTHFILYQDNYITLTTELLLQLSRESWTSLSNCISFADVDFRRMSFWDRCAESQDWDAISSRAQPLVSAWSNFIQKSIVSGIFGFSLYNDVSNILITLMCYHLNTLDGFKSVLENTLDVCEKAMYRWYENEAKQRGAFLACMSQIEHLRYVWINNEKKYSMPFPNELHNKILSLISEWRFLWDNPLFRDKAQKEMDQLRIWLQNDKSMNTSEENRFA